MKDVILEALDNIRHCISVAWDEMSRDNKLFLTGMLIGLGSGLVLGWLFF